jgi:hypothetical protein
LARIKTDLKGLGDLLLGTAGKYPAAMKLLDAAVCTSETVLRLMLSAFHGWVWERLSRAV